MGIGRSCHSTPETVDDVLDKGLPLSQEWQRIQKCTLPLNDPLIAMASEVLQLCQGRGRDGRDYSWCPDYGAVALFERIETWKQCTLERRHHKGVGGVPRSLP
jgi:hypothetical protein